MDFFPGQTLECGLKDTHPLGLRRLMAYRLVDDVCGMAYSGIYHGDLHHRNLMVDARETSLLDRIEPSFALIDFGTVCRQSFWDRERLKIRESLARLVFNVMRPADGAASGDWRLSVV